MSAIDERIVQMTFNNSQFESGVSQSLGTIDKLKSALNFDNQSKALENLGSTVNGINFGILGTALDTASSGFNALETVAVGALLEIGRKVEQLGSKIIHELAFDQVNAGFKKFESETRNVASIMNQSGKTLDEVEDYIDKLNWYSDVTSFDTSAMTNALTQFTAQGVDLETATNAIMGIGNSVTYAGKSAQEGARAFGIWARALGQGHLMGMQVKSLNLMGILTKSLKQDFIDAAVELGKLKKGQVTIEKFDETLNKGSSKGWLDKEVMMKVFGTKYGQFTEDIYDFTRTTEQEKDTVLTLNEALELYDKDVDEFGKKVLLSATLARTFQDAIDAAKDAASSQWKEIFKAIIGNSEEATEVWTALNDVLVTLFAQPVANIASVFKTWRRYGGRTAFLDGISNTWQGLTNIVNALSEALDRLYPKITGQSLTVFTEKITRATEKFKEFTESFEFLGGDDPVKKLGSDFVKRIIEETNLGKSYEEAFQDALEKTQLDKISKSLLGSVADVTGNMEEATVYRMNELANHAKNWVKLQTVFEGIASAAEIFKMALEGLKDGLKKLEPSVVFIRDTFIDLAVRIAEITTSVKNYLKEHDTFRNAFETLFGTVNKIFMSITNLKGALEWVLGIIEKIGTKLKDFFAVFKEKDINIVLNLSKAIESFGKGLNSVWKVISAVGEKIGGFLLNLFASLGQIVASFDFSEMFTIINGSLLAGFLSKMNGFAKGLNGLFARLVSGDIFNNLTNNLFGLFTKIQEVKGDLPEKLVNIGKGLLMISAAMILLATINTEDEIAAVFAGLTGAIAGLLIPLAALTLLVKKIGTVQIIKLSSAVLSISTSILIFSGALKLLSTIDIEQMKVGLLGLTGIIVLLIAFLNSADLSGMTISAGAGILLLATGILALTGALALLGSIDMDTLAQGFGSLTLIFLELGFFLAAMRNNSNVLAIGASLALMSVGLLAVAAAITILGAIPWQWALQGVIAFTVALSALAMVTGIMADPKIFVGAAGILALAAAMLVLTPAIVILGAIPIKAIAKALITLVLALILFGGASILLSGLIVPMLGVAAALIVFGAALAAVGGGLILLSAGITAFVGMLVGAVKAIVKLFETVIKAGIAVLSFLGKMFSSDTASGYSEDFVDGFDTTLFEKSMAEYGTGGVKGLDSTKPSWRKEGTALSKETTLGIKDSKKDFKAANIDFGKSGITGLDSLLGDFNLEGGKIGGNLISGFSGTNADFTSMLKEYGIGGADTLGGFAGLFSQKGGLLGQSFADGAKEKKETVKYSFAQLGEAGKESLDDYIDKYVDSGKQVAIGYATGLALPENKHLLRRKMDELYFTSEEQLRMRAEISSPSRKFMYLGEMTAEGFVIGLGSLNNEIEKTSVEIADSAMSALAAPMDLVAEALDKDYDDTYTITPVLNLKEIQNGANQMNQMLHAPSITPYSGYYQTQQAMMNAGLMGRLASLENSMATLIVNANRRNDINMADAIKEAMAGTGVYLDRTKVGQIVTESQANVRKARGV